MDRNTLLAFLLISLVLIFTPKYMELVSPTVEIGPSSDTTSVELTSSADRNRLLEKGYSDPKEKPTLKKLEIISWDKEKGEIKNDEETILIETALYSANISSINGGTLKSFFTKEYQSSDSAHLNLLRGLNPNNLALFIQDLDGNPLNLKKAWKLETAHVPNFLTETHSLLFSLNLLGGKVTKTLTFAPDSYLIDVEFNCEGVSNKIFRDLQVGWFGGLSPTEEDEVGDQVYFKSYIYQGGELEDQKVKIDKSEKNTFNGPADWVAIRTKYFVSALIPKDPSIIEKTILSSTYDGREIYNASFLLSSRNKSSFSLYLGPLEYDKIKAVGVDLDMVMDFGWAPLRPVSKGVLYALKTIHGFIPNYGLVLIVFSFLVKLLVYPLTKKSYQSTSAMQSIQPEINLLREKYKSNPNKLNQATMKLYKEKGVNPLGGCLPMLLQMPLLLALFQVFRTTIELRSEPFIWWIKDLSAPDTVVHLPFNVPIYGDQISILPILMVISMFIQQRMMAPNAQQPQQKTMQYFMTGFFFLMFNSFPSGLNLYYTLFNVLTIAQQKFVPSAAPSKK